jgi:ABC-type lipoprotein release transport system permease subunit
MRSGDLIAASIGGVEQRYGRKCVSPELYLGTQVTPHGDDEPTMGLVRGVVPAVLSVRNRVQVVEGSWPESGEVIVGRLAAAKLGATSEQLAVGQSVAFEGRTWRISGVYSAGGAAIESELWCRLDELQQAMKRQDLSVVLVRVASEADFAELDMFCKERLDLELQTARETDYYARLQKDYGPVRWLAWLVVVLVSGAGAFAGLNTLYGAVLGRIGEIATLQTMGFARRAIVVSLMQEGVLLAAAASLAATGIAIALVNGVSVRFTMGAFDLRVDPMTVLVGCGVGISLGLFGAIPPAVRALRLPIVEGLRAV